MSSSPEIDRSPQTKVKSKINESLLTNAFDDCLKLVEKSVKNGQSSQTRTETSKKGKKEPDPKQVVEITNKSKKFRYVNLDEAKSANPPIVMPPPPVDIKNLPMSENQDEARASMLMAWYMAGYHTGYFDAMTKFNK